MMDLVIGHKFHNPQAKINRGFQTDFWFQENSQLVYVSMRTHITGLSERVSSNFRSPIIVPNV